MHGINIQVDDTDFFDIRLGLGILVNHRSWLVVFIESCRVTDLPTQSCVIQDLDGLFQGQVAHIGHLHLLAMGSKHVDEQQGDIAQCHQCQHHQSRVQQDGMAITKAVKSALIVVVLAHGFSNEWLQFAKVVFFGGKTNLHVSFLLRIT